MIIGISGYICSGKSTFIKKLLKEKSFHIDLDVVSNAFFITDSVQKEIKEKLYYKDICHENGLIDKKKLSDICFKDKNILKEIENILLPKIEEDIFRFISASNRCFNYFIVDGANLCDSSKITNECNIIFFIDTPYLIRLFRYFKRNNTLNVFKFNRINKIQKEKYIKSNFFDKVIKIKG
jgi:dephospho-CoA kinase